MLAKRLLVLYILIPAVVFFIYLGGWALTGFVTLLIGVCGWEYWRMFKMGGYSPSLVVIIGGSSLLIISRSIYGFGAVDWQICLIIFVAMTIHLVSYERGIKTSAIDFVVTVIGALYLGWLSAYMISLRNLPDGIWWALLVFPAVSFADGGAYAIGRNFGRHKMAPLLSPKKTWEGYFGGIVTGALFTLLLAFLWHLRAPSITPLKGLVLGIILSVLTTLGDLSISLFKRYFGLKDTSNIFPGHGGALDRFDSMLWALPIGFYVIIWMGW